MKELLDLICKKCNTPFKGTTNMKYCPRCRFIKYDYDTDRVVGEKVKCESCGKEYIFVGGTQTLCPECQGEVSKRQVLDSNAKYNRKKYDNITFRVPKGNKQKYMDHAEKQKISFNQFIIDAMDNQIIADNKKDIPEE